MTQMPGAQYFWRVGDASSSLAANLGSYWNHPFRMTTSLRSDALVARV